jgi:hypothetical protein
MADSNILAKAERALSAYLTQAGVTATIYTGEGNSDKSAPCAICVADSAEVADGLEYTGNRNITASVTVKSIAADDTGTDHDTLVQAVGDALNSDGLVAGLSAYTGFTCIGAYNLGESLAQDSDCWVSEFRLFLHACPSDVDA